MEAKLNDYKSDTNMETILIWETSVNTPFLGLTKMISTT